MNINDQEKDKNLIIKLFNQGNTYREIYKLTGFCITKICKYVKGMRTPKQARRLAIIKGRCKLTEKGRLKLSESGRKACQKSGKFYTKPQKMFKEILNKIYIGVKFPDYIKEIKHIQDDINEFCLLFQYPIQRYVVDFVDIKNKIAININGDYWHANPLLYDRNNLGKLQQINVRQDKNKKIFLEKNGWKVLDIWESEIYWNKEFVIEKLRAVGITEARLDYTQKTGVQFPHCPPLDWSETLQRLWFKKDRKPREKLERITKTCKCGKQFVCIKYKNKQRKYCSYECFKRFNTNPNKPSKEELEKLINEISFVKLGEKYGVSDVTIKNWCKRYGIITGNRLGYWSKKRK